MKRYIKTYRFKDADATSTSLVGPGRGMLPGINGGVREVDGGGAYPLTGVLAAPERIPLALRDANMSPRLADKDGVVDLCGAGCGWENDAWEIGGVAGACCAFAIISAKFLDNSKD